MQLHSLREGNIPPY